MMRFEGKTVLIVGAASGLGSAIADAFHRDGARLVLVDRDAQGLARHAERDPRCTTLCGDAADPKTVDEAVRVAGTVDVLVHTAGIDPLSATDVPGTSLLDWQTVLSVNLTSAFLAARAVLPGMIGRRRGTLLFTGSVAGVRPTPREAAYSVSKAGVIQLARAIALDHAREGIRANALCPGFLESVMADRRGMLSERELEDRSRTAAALVPLGREGRYDEMAALALTLCDDAVSGYVTGQAIVADGGMLLG
jgi:NAD(P)-dependent dehydrogenase (short-subunit alcohol dehydrogenase family)